jgi:hypothetical protein
MIDTRIQNYYDKYIGKILYLKHYNGREYFRAGLFLGLYQSLDTSAEGICLGFLDGKTRWNVNCYDGYFLRDFKDRIMFKDE